MDPFALMGLSPSFEIDLGDLDRRYRALQRTLHPDRHVQSPLGERRANLSLAVSVNEAYRTLRDDLMRAEALLLRWGGAEARKPASQDPQLLMDVMTLREALADARAARDLGGVQALAAELAARESAALAALARSLGALSLDPAGARVAVAQGDLARLRYYRRFQDELRALEGELLE